MNKIIIEVKKRRWSGGVSLKIHVFTDKVPGIIYPVN